MEKKVKPCDVCKKPMEYQRETKSTCSPTCRMAKIEIKKGRVRPPKKSIPDGHKWCPACESVLTVDRFYTGKDGKVFSYCRECKKLYDAKYRRTSRGLPEDAVLVPGTTYPIGTTYVHRGYVLEKVGYDKTSHHRSNKNGWVYQHILVAEKKYGFPITRKYTVHHKNADRGDNRPENLELRHGNHGKGGDIMAFLLKHDDERAQAMQLLEEYGYTVTRTV